MLPLTCLEHIFPRFTRARFLRDKGHVPQVSWGYHGRREVDRLCRQQLWMMGTVTCATFMRSILMVLQRDAGA